MQYLYKKGKINLKKEEETKVKQRVKVVIDLIILYHVMARRFE